MINQLLSNCAEKKILILNGYQTIFWKFHHIALLLEKIKEMVYFYFQLFLGSSVKKLFVFKGNLTWFNSIASLKVYKSEFDIKYGDNTEIDVSKSIIYTY
jgi:hypothetical protein